MHSTFKKATKAVLAGALLSSAFATTVSANGFRYSDLPETNMHFNNIYNLTSREVVSGYPDRTYRPAGHLTRAEAAKILVAALNLPMDDIGSSPFPDVKKGTWYHDSVVTLAEYGIIEGYDTGKFGPNDKLTRSQMAKILTDAYNLYPADEVEVPFTDVVEGSWYDEYVQALYLFDVTKGITPTKFGPKEFVRRDTIATFVINAEEVLEEDKAEEWMDYSVGYYNAIEGSTASAVADTEANTIDVTIAQSGKKIEDTYLLDVIFLLLPVFEMQQVYVKGESVDITELDMNNDAYDYLLDQMGLTYESDVNELGGKSLTLVFQGLFGEEFEYTISYNNEDN